LGKSICILGRQPALSLAELESLYGGEHIKPLPGAALLDIDSAEINFKRLGGTLKVAKLLTILDTDKWPEALDYLIKTIPQHLKYLPEGSFTLGLSLYNFNVPVKSINRNLLEIKKVIKAAGRGVRVVPNKKPELNAAQVLHNKLTRKGAWELLAIRGGGKTYLAQTMFVQDIDAYAARDQTRPKRDARVGMLPPKLAQIIINLATGKLESPVTSNQSLVKQLETGDLGLATAKSKILLDPFCGTGVILQEALLMGYNVIGGDIDPKMVEYTKTNLEWLIPRFQMPDARFQVIQADVAAAKWPDFDTVASETYLGRPLQTIPPPDEFHKIVNDVNTIIKKFLQNLAPQLKNGTRICLAVPAWRISKNDFKHLPLIDDLTDVGYNQLDFVHVNKRDLIYFREGQIVARELLVLEKVESEE